ncbi:MAG: NUDIX hydrolase [Candidatus Micrarchaeota archaeon]|nr:NUDIX hydrolase [Candidatus Micrarchaeota archaeon]
MKSKLPKRAKLVFKGKLWDVYQWKEKMFDGTYGTFEGLRKKSGVKIFATMNGKILIAEERQPGRGRYYTLFGGGIEKNETPLAAAKRELLEETGLASNKWKLLDTVDVLDYPRVDYYVHLFIARDCFRVGKQNLENGEKINVLEVKFSQFIKLLRKNKRIFGPSVGKLLTDEKRLSFLKSKL